MNFQKFLRTSFLQNTSGRLLLTFNCNSLIQKYLSDVSTRGCIAFLVISETKVHSQVYTLRLQFILRTWNLIINECHRKHFNYTTYELRSFFIKKFYNSDNQSFQEHSTGKFCFNENLFTYSGKSLDTEPSASGCFLERKYFISERLFAKQLIL